MLEYRNHGEWALIISRISAREEGEYSVTAENYLGSSTRDWKIRVRREEAKDDNYEDMTVHSATEGDMLFSAKPAVIDSVSDSRKLHNNLGTMGD